MITLEQAKIFSEIFQAAGIGTGSLLGGLGALKVLSDWQSKRRYKKDKKYWLNRFPKEGLDQDFKLMVRSYSEDVKANSRSKIIGRSPHIYVCDMRTKTRHWIANPRTLRILGFNDGEVEGVSEKVLKTYSMSKKIDLDPDNV